MRGRIGSERKPRNDGESGVAQGTRERLRVAGALGRRVAASNDGECRLAQQLEAPDGVQERRRIADLEQRFRVRRVIERDQGMTRGPRPFERARDCLRDVLRVQTIEHFGRQSIR